MSKQEFRVTIEPGNKPFNYEDGFTAEIEYRFSHRGAHWRSMGIRATGDNIFDVIENLAAVAKSERETRDRLAAMLKGLHNDQA